MLSSSARAAPRIQSARADRVGTCAGRVRGRARIRYRGIGTRLARNTVSADAARRLLLAGCALHAAPPKATSRSVLALVRSLGFVQVDSISSVERAHHLIMHARLEGYAPSQLVHHVEGTRRIFEHWTHDASLIRSDWLPWWAHRFERDRRRMLRSSWMRQRLGRNWSMTVRRVVDALGGSGPMSLREMHELMPAGRARSSGWWEWSPCKAALEYLWRAGEVAIHSRNGFEKRYDLAHRVHGAAPEIPSHESHAEWACREAIERLGAATPREIASFMGAISPADAAKWCARAAREGTVEEVTLERHGREARAGFAVAAWRQRAERSGVDSTSRLLCPFDPLIRDRSRLRELFGFDYRFEAYVPAAKRTHGYYTMPVLVGDRLICRLDLSSDRERGVVRVDRAWAERGGSVREAAGCARSAAERLATQLDLGLEWRAKMMMA